MNPSLTTTPEHIDVLWELHDGRRVWWPAIVTNVAKRSDCDQTEASILYEPKYGYPAMEVEVLFLDDDVIRQNSGLTAPGDKKQAHVDTSWRVRQKPSPRGHGSKHVPIQKKGSHQNRRTTSSQKRSGTIEEVAAEIELLRKSNARSQERLELLTRRMELASFVKETSYISRGEQLMRLQVCLRQRLIRQIEKPPRIPKKQSNQHTNERYDIGNGIARTYITASVDCALDLFEEFARHCKTTHNDNTAPLQYIPSFHMTQGAAQGAKEFQVLFPSLATICDQLLLHSTADRLEMVCKYGCVRGEGVLRILGSYNYDPDDDSKESKLFPAHSCGLERSDSRNEAAVLRKTPALVRKAGYGISRIENISTPW